PVNDSTRRSVALALLNLGKTQLIAKRLDEARSSFTRAVAVDPRLIEPYLQLARLEESGGHDERASEHYGQYIGRAPRATGALCHIGFLYGRTYRCDEAANAFSMALRIDPQLAPAKRGLVMALEMQKRTAATTPATTRSTIEGRSNRGDAIGAGNER